MGTPATENNSLDRRLADKAWFSASKIHLVFQLEKSSCAIGIDIVGHGRPTQLDRLAQDRLQRDSEFRQFPSGQPACLTPRTNSCAEEAFISIDIADPVK